MTYNTKPITSFAEALRYFEWLTQNDLLWHPDDPAEECIGHRLANDRSVIVLQDRMDECHALPWPEGHCPSTFALAVSSAAVVRVGDHHILRTGIGDLYAGEKSFIVMSDGRTCYCSISAFLGASAMERDAFVIG